MNPLKPILSAAILTLLAPATSAHASTMPLVDFRPHAITFAAGLADVSLDVGVSDSLSVGGTAIAIPMLAIYTGAVRATYRLTGGAGQPSLGLSVAGGYAPSFFTSTDAWWVQPALVGALPIGRSGVTVRASLGPMLYRHTYTTWMMFANNTPSTTLSAMLVPNAEVAWSLGANQELTLGGNGLLGWRGSF
jgi:hypothetical protein